MLVFACGSSSWMIGSEKPGGLAGAGLGGAHDVAALQHDRDGLGLDRGRVHIALVRQRAQDFGRQAEIGKAHGRRAASFLCGRCFRHVFFRALI
jgi:hypothetical protein